MSTPQDIEQRSALLKNCCIGYCLAFYRNDTFRDRLINTTLIKRSQQQYLTMEEVLAFIDQTLITSIRYFQSRHTKHRLRSKFEYPLETVYPRIPDLRIRQNNSDLNMNLEELVNNLATDQFLAPIKNSTHSPWLFFELAGKDPHQLNRYWSHFFVLYRHDDTRFVVLDTGTIQSIKIIDKNDLDSMIKRKCLQYRPIQISTHQLISDMDPNPPAKRRLLPPPSILRNDAKATPNTD